MDQNNSLETLDPESAAWVALGQSKPDGTSAVQGATGTGTKVNQSRATPNSLPYFGLIALANGRDVLPTDEAARALNRRPQTMRKWACLENGPIRPIRINGRLAWRVSDLMSLLSGEVAQ